MSVARRSALSMFAAVALGCGEDGGSAPELELYACSEAPTIAAGAISALRVHGREWDDGERSIDLTLQRDGSYRGLVDEQPNGPGSYRPMRKQGCLARAVTDRIFAIAEGPAPAAVEPAPDADGAQYCLAEIHRGERIERMDCGRPDVAHELFDEFVARSSDIGSVASCPHGICGVSVRGGTTSGYVHEVSSPSISHTLSRDGTLMCYRYAEPADLSLHARVSPRSAAQAVDWLVAGLDWREAPRPPNQVLDTYGTYDNIGIHTRDHVWWIRRDRGAGAWIAARWQRLMARVSERCTMIPPQ